MRQAQTLNEAQLRRVIQYCRSRRHPTRDETIILISFYAGLRAKEIAALTMGNVFDEQGAVREQFILTAEQSKGGKTRTVYVRHLLIMGQASCTVTRSTPCLKAKRVELFLPIQCASYFWISTKRWGSRMRQAIQAAGHTSHD
jgi:integrase